MVDDRSTDGTGQLAARATQVVGIGEVTRVVRRGPLAGTSTGPPVHPLPDRKGATLSAAGPADYRGDFIPVLDADARAGPDYLRRTATYFARGAGAMSARRRTLRHRPRNWFLEQLEGARADEQDADGEIQLGRWGNSDCSECRAKLEARPARSALGRRRMALGRALRRPGPLVAARYPRPAGRLGGGRRGVGGAGARSRCAAAPEAALGG